jgi:hypothetical protein
MNEDMADLDERLSGEYAALRDTPAVMRASAGYLEELQGVVIRLGDAIEQSGLPGKLWRSDEAGLAALGDNFPLITVDELITRMAQFAAERGPAWLRGSAADLDAFRDEARILYDVVHALRVVAQRLRMSGGGTRGGSALERAIGAARVATPLDRVAVLLETLDALGPFMGQIAPDEWLAGAGRSFAPSAALAESPAIEFSATENAADSQDSQDSQARGRLRDYAPADGAGGSSNVAKTGVAGRLRLNAPVLLRNRWALGAAGAVIVGALVAFLILRPPAFLAGKNTPSATPPPALVASPTTLTLLCSTRKTAALTLKNQSAAPVTWQAQAPATVALAPAQGTIPAGQSVTLQAHLTAARATTGAITFTIGKTSLSVPYLATC